MNADIYSEWLRRQGQTVVRTASSYWHSEGMGVYQAFPYQALIQPDESELHELTLRHHALALRYSLPAGSAQGTAGYHAVYTGTHYDFDVLSSWARKNVRRGLRQCTVEPISFDRYVEEGWALRLDTLARQGRRLKESQEDWKRRYSAAADLAGFEVWAAQVQDQLAATLVIFQMQDWYYMVYQQCHRNYLQEHVNNALSFVVTQELVRRPNVHGIFYGMQSLDAPASVDEFKFRMGYEARAVRQRIVFHPHVSPWVNAFTHVLVKTATNLIPARRWLTKTEGMMRLALAEKNF
jgi:hypothetical protein